MLRTHRRFLPAIFAVVAAGAVAFAQQPDIGQGIEARIEEVSRRLAAEPSRTSTERSRSNQPGRGCSACAAVFC